MRALLLSLVLLSGCAVHQGDVYNPYTHSEKAVWTVQKACLNNPAHCPGAVEIRTPGPGPFFPY